MATLERTRRTRSPLPTTMDGVDAAWLTEALQNRFPGIAIAGVTRDRERAGTSMSARFTLDLAYRGDRGDAPDTVYVKGGFDDVMRRRVWLGLIQEARFFHELAPAMPASIPTAYYAGWDFDERQGIVILEDMSARNVNFGYATDVLTVDDVARILSGLARFPAHFWGDLRLASYRDWADPQRTFLRYLMRDRNWDVVEGRIYAPMLAQVFPTREFGRKMLETLWRTNDAAPVHTLVHGDCHSGNLFYEADGTPGFLDWQCTFPGVPGHDHGEMMVTTLATEDRRRHERDLIGHYRDELIAYGVRDAPDRDALFQDYRRNILHIMASGVFNPYDMQVQLVTDQSATRTLHAAIDLEVTRAFA